MSEIERPNWDGGGALNVESRERSTDDDARTTGFDVESRWAKHNGESPPARPDWPGRDLIPAPNPMPATGLEFDGEAYVRDLEAQHNGQDAKQAVPASGVNSLDPKLVAKMAAAPGGLEQNFQALQNAASKVLSDNISDHETFIAYFDTLPQGIQTKAYEVLLQNSNSSFLDLLDKVEKTLTLDEMYVAEQWVRGLKMGAR